MTRRVLRGLAILLVAFPEPVTTMLGVALLFASYAQFSRPKADSPERLETLLQEWAHYHRPIGYMLLSGRTAPARVAGLPHRTLPYRRMASMQPIKLGADIRDERSQAFQRDYLAWCRETGRVPLAQHIAYYGAIARAMKTIQSHGAQRPGIGPGGSLRAAPAGSRLSREAAGMAAGGVIPARFPWGAETRGLARSSR